MGFSNSLYIGSRKNFTQLICYDIKFNVVTNMKPVKIKECGENFLNVTIINLLVLIKYFREQMLSLEVRKLSRRIFSCPDK